MQLLAIPIGIGVVDFGLDLVDASGDIFLGTCAIDDGGGVLGDDDALRLAE